VLKSCRRLSCSIADENGTYYLFSKELLRNEDGARFMPLTSRGQGIYLSASLSQESGFGTIEYPYVKTE
jgi:hypothetical protein